MKTGGKKEDSGIRGIRGEEIRSRGISSRDVEGKRYGGQKERR